MSVGISKNTIYNSPKNRQCTHHFKVVNWKWQQARHFTNLETDKYLLTVNK